MPATCSVILGLGLSTTLILCLPWKVAAFMLTPLGAACVSAIWLSSGITSFWR